MLSQALLNKLIAVCGSQYVLADHAAIQPYGQDQSLFAGMPFDAVLKPSSPREISNILRICNENGIPVTPRGGGSGVTGGALPARGGIVLSLERLNKIIDINRKEKLVLLEAGVITEDLCNEVEKEGLYFPTVPSSKAVCMVGGNVAHNSGSINSCRYGSIRQYVINLEVVLPSGEIIWTGSNVKKSSTALNLTQLFIGSEGTLGVITKIMLKLLPPPGRELWLLAGFDSLDKACDAVFSIARLNITPLAAELIGHNALSLTSKYIREQLPLTGENIRAQLLIGLQEPNDFMLENARDIVSAILEKYNTEGIYVADNESEMAKLMRLRLGIAEAMLQNNMKYRDIDTCVPLSFLYEYLQQVESICAEYDVPLVCFGHALDGNIHSMLQLPKDAGREDSERVEKAAHQIYKYTASIGGVISGEHGIGLLQKQYMRYQFSEVHLNIMTGIKKLFDPNGILNPDKMLL